MLTTADTFREIHRLRKLIRDLDEQIAEGPSLLKGQQNELTRAEAGFKQAQDDLKHLKVSVHDKETSLKAAHQQIAKYEKQRETAQSKKEMDAFETEIGHARKKCAQLEDEILNGMGEIDERTANLPNIEKDMKRVREETAVFQQEAAERHQRLLTESERARSELAQAERTLPDETRPEYIRLVQRFGADALAAVKDRSCQNCHGSLTIQHNRELEMGRFKTCNNCGRVLYV